jgi:hypothetical protein
VRKKGFEILVNFHVVRTLDVSLRCLYGSVIRRAGKFGECSAQSLSCRYPSADYHYGV